MYSSPIASPFSETIANLSASASCAKPTCAFSFLTTSHSCFKFSGIGSGLRGKIFVTSVFIGITSQPSSFKSLTVIIEPAPLQESITTLNFLFFIFSTSTEESISDICMS